MSINPTAPKYTEKAHRNFMGGMSWDINNPIMRLRTAASSCFFGEPTYYVGNETETPDRRLVYPPAGHSAAVAATLGTPLFAREPDLTPAQMMTNAIDAALDFDPEATLSFAAELRSTLNIRTTPQVIMVRAAHHPNVRGTNLIRTYAPGIILRADEPAAQLAYNNSAYGRRSIPNSLKRAWADTLAKFDEYQLAKYQMGSRSVSTVDVINVSHAHSPAIDDLMKGNLTNAGKTWEAILSGGGSWTEALAVMGHMALLRNLRNLHNAGIEPAFYLDKLIQGVPTGRQLPFRYYTAYNIATQSGLPAVVLEALELCMNTALENVPFFEGNTISLVDNSGSAQATFASKNGTVKISAIANLMGAITGFRSQNGAVGVFGDKLEIVPINKRGSILETASKLDKIGDNIGQATETGIWTFFDQAITDKAHWDNIFIYSDMQAGYSQLYGHTLGDYKKRGFANGRYIDIPKVINAYRKAVNPQVNVYLVQVAGYQDTIVPEMYYRTSIIGGWSEAVLAYAAQTAKTFDVIDNPTQ